MSEVATAPAFGQRLETTLRDGLARVGIEAVVEVEPVRTTLLHRAVVVSPQFVEMGFLDRQEVVWRIVKHAFSPDEQLYVSSIWTMTPDEVEGK